MRVVVDSNILLASVLPDEPLTTEAQKLLSMWTSAQTRLVAPRLFRYELVAVVRKAVFQKRITYAEGLPLLERLLAYPIDLYDEDALMTHAFEIASRFNMPRTYDAQYVALADRFNCECWTADKALYNVIQPQFSGIRWLGHFAAP